MCIEYDTLRLWIARNVAQFEHRKEHVIGNKRTV